MLTPRRKLIYFFLLFTSVAFGRNDSTEAKVSNKGKFYFYWGWNRSIFSASDLHFKGTGYQFTLHRVIAKDRQSPFDLGVYLNPATATIPQYNNRLGYNINEHYSISLGEDHMKYVMQNNQVVRINGTIGLEDTTFNKTYADEDIKLTTEFLKFEHTDGLNYIDVEFRRFDELYRFKKSFVKGLSFHLTEGAGLGFLLPRTNTTLLGKPRYDQFHLSGYGLSAVIGVSVLFGEHFFIQSELKGGYINMPDIRTTSDKADRASQQFVFLQRNILFGWSFRIKSKTSTSK